MPLVWQRHPRYFISVAIVIVTTIYLLNPYQSLRTDLYEPAIRDSDLSARVERAEQVYSKMVADRKEMIRKFGPTARDIQMFPEDKEPWPPYTVWSFFPPSYQCPHEMERVGSLGDGGKWTCGLSRLQHKPECIIYTFGMNYETSFEADALGRTRYCEIRDRRAHFHPWGLGSADAHDPGDDNQLYTLKTLLEINKHRYIDILKVDIEGLEFDVLSQILQPYVASGEPVPFGQLLIEIHAWDRKFEDFLSWWEMLESAGLRPFMSEVNLVYQNYNRGKESALVEYSFINIKGDNIFIADPSLGDSDGAVS
ncbi:methyltransferase domain-containing protein [Boletus edulis]|nr:methyltransferase domain-containing protein [Boletus edulis]